VWKRMLWSIALVGAMTAARAGEGEFPGEREHGWFKCAREIQRGNLGAAHEALKEQGVEFAFSLDLVWQSHHEGGIRSHPEGRTTASWNAALRLDTEKLGLWRGGAFFVHLEGSKGRGIDEPFVGSFFGVNGDADSTAGHRLQFSEYWFEQAFGDGLVAVRVGKMDASTDFDTNAFANDECTQFLNGALVNNPTIPFPDYGLGAQAIVRPGGGFYLAAGAWDANAEGWTSGRRTALGGDADWLVAGEAGVEAALPAPGGGTLPGTCRVGRWHDQRRVEQIGTERGHKGQSGCYVSIDQMVYRESPDEEDEQGLGLFARCGHAPEKRNEVSCFWSLGAQYRGLIPSRDDDTLGVGIATGRLGAPARRESRYRGEAVCECYYCVALHSLAALTFDLQFVRHPGAALASSLVPGLRLHLEF